jgi:hypothetical protein
MANYLSFSADPFQSLWCLCSSLLACSCFTSGESTTGPRRNYLNEAFLPHKFLFQHVNSIHCVTCTKISVKIYRFYLLSFLALIQPITFRIRIKKIFFSNLRSNISTGSIYGISILVYKFKLVFIFCDVHTLSKLNIILFVRCHLDLSIEVTDVLFWVHKLIKRDVQNHWFEQNELGKFVLPSRWKC